jgi:mannose-6-phosphate isomerase-like protein (cupin superfamily)
MKFKKINLGNILPIAANERRPSCRSGDIETDHGNKPYVFNACELARQNRNYRTTIWTGVHMQLTLMCIPAGTDTGIEMHNNFDQLIRIESGMGKIEMGGSRSELSQKADLNACTTVIIPKGTYHRIISTGNQPLRLLSVYAPPAHKYGTVDRTKDDESKKEH